MNYLLVALLHKLWFGLGRVPLISLFCLLFFLFVCLFCSFSSKNSTWCTENSKGQFWAEENLVVNNKSNGVFLSWDASADGCHFEIDVCFSIKAQPANICFNWNIKSLQGDYQWFVHRQKHSTVKVVIREQEAEHPSALLVPKPRAAVRLGDTVSLETRLKLYNLPCQVSVWQATYQKRGSPLNGSALPKTNLQAIVVKLKQNSLHPPATLSGSRYLGICPGCSFTLKLIDV